MNRSELVEKNYPELSVRKQCALLGVMRSVYYYKPMKQSEEERKLARALDKIYMIDPCMGSRRLVTKLNEGYGIGTGNGSIDTTLGDRMRHSVTEPLRKPIVKIAKTRRRPRPHENKPNQ